MQSLGYFAIFYVIGAEHAARYFPVINRIALNFLKYGKSSKRRVKGKG
jgi:hypothetical protein